MITKIFKTIVVLTIIFFKAMAQAPSKPDPNLQIYLLLGQSNMAGRGQLDSAYQAISNPKVLVWSIENTWAIAKHPLHYDKPKVAGVGPGLSFGLAMAAANSKVKIGLVPCAVGGTSIDVWKPGAFDKTTNTHPYDDAVKRIKEASKYGVIKGIIWHQGEANSSPEKMIGYINKLSELLGRIRALTGNENLPVVIGELGRFKESYQPFNQQLSQATKNIHHLAIATTESLTDKGDSTHFDSLSATILGERLAKLMLQLQKDAVNKN